MPSAFLCLPATLSMNSRTFVGASYFPEKMNNIFAQYFTDAGFEVLAMEGIGAPFADVPKVPPEKVLEFMLSVAGRHKKADGIYMLSRIVPSASEAESGLFE